MELEHTLMQEQMLSSAHTPIAFRVLTFMKTNPSYILLEISGSTITR